MDMAAFSETNRPRKLTRPGAVFCLTTVLLLTSWPLGSVTSSVFSLPRHRVSRQLEKLNEDRGLLLRSPISKVGADAVELTPQETSSLNIISSAAKKLKWHAAKKAWESCKVYKAPMCNGIMHAAFRCGQFRYGAKVYADMCDAGTLPTAITYTSAVRLFTKLKNHAKARSLWEDARNGTWPTWTPRQKYLFLNEMVIDAATAADLARVSMLLDEIVKEGMEIDAGTWGAALNGCKLAAKPNVAEYFLELMAQRNIPANEVHFRCVMAAYAGRPWQQVNEVASRAAQLGIDTLDRFFVDVHVASLLGSLSQTSRVKSQAQARKLVDEAKPEHRRATLDVIAQAKAQGTDLLRLTSRVYRALQAKC